MRNLTGKQIILSIVVLLIWIYAYNIPIQRIKAEIAVNKYMTLQNVDFSQIESKEVIKDWTQNGHYIIIKYKDDPGKIYDYQYKKNGEIALIIYDSSWRSIGNHRYAKYPRLTDEYQDELSN